jgi:hypothetical protein
MCTGARTHERSLHMERFVNDDTGYLAWLADHPGGFVLNTFPHVSSSYLVLHRSSCRTINRSLAGGRHWTDQYGKACSEDRLELAAWALRETGKAVSACGLCLPGDALAKRPSSSGASPLRTAHGGADLESRPRLGRSQGIVAAPTAVTLADARVRYREIEARDLFYRAATDLVRRARDDQSSPLSLGEAVAVLLFTWNSAFYRYHPPTVDHVERIEDLLRSTQPALDHWRRAELRPAEILGWPTEILATFTEFETLLGPVGAAKALHLLAPGFFPIWDRTIAAAYRCGLGKAGTNAERYARFMSHTAEQCERLRGEPGAPADLVKALDEWNYVTYTRTRG